MRNSFTMMRAVHRLACALIMVSQGRVFRPEKGQCVMRSETFLSTIRMPWDVVVLASIMKNYTIHGADLRAASGRHSASDTIPYSE